MGYSDEETLFCPVQYGRGLLMRPDTRPVQIEIVREG